MKQSRTLRPGALRSVVAALALAGAAGGAMFWVAPARAAQFSASAEPSIPPGALIRAWTDNGEGGSYLLQLIGGNAPPRGATLGGAVTSDTNCTPDAQGLSHCHNGIDLDNGMRLLVVDNHAMMRHPCLKPGQRVAVSGFSSRWVTLRAARG